MAPRSESATVHNEGGLPSKVLQSLRMCTGCGVEVAETTDARIPRARIAHNTRTALRAGRMIRLRLRTLSTDRRCRQAKRTTQNRLRARIAPARAASAKRGNL